MVPSEIDPAFLERVVMLSLAVPAGVRSLVIEVGLVGHEGCRDFISVCERSFAGLRGHFGMLAEGGALDRDYTAWFEEHRATPELLVRQRERLAAHPGPLVSIVIPSRDHADLLEACASSILQKTEYSNFEIVVVENGSENPETFELYGRLQEDGRVRVVTWTPDLLRSGRANRAWLQLLGARELRCRPRLRRAYPATGSPPACPRSIPW